MWPFKKTQKKETPPEAPADITAIPEIFYGGQDPDIYYHHTQTTVGQDLVNEMPGQKARTAVRKPSTGKKTSPFFSKKVVLIVAGSLLFLLATAGISWYYLRDLFAVKRNASQSEVDRTSTPILQQEDKSKTMQEVVKVTEIATTTPTTTLALGEPESTSTTTPALSETFFDFPPLVYINTVDLDADELTDMEEELLGTDTGIWDTDSDGYYDGQEVVNLYNPKGEAPVKLIDSGLVAEYVNPTFGYRLYYPLGWERGSVDAQAKQVLFSAFSGEYVEVRASAKDAGMDFTQWFSNNAEGEQLTDLVSLTNRFKESGLKRKDGLIAYFETEKYVYVLLYHSEGRGPVPYRHMLEMMIQSFRPQKTSVEIPDQIPLPGTPDITKEDETNTSTPEAET